MALAPPQLKRGLFGYKPTVVRQLLADRDRMCIRASEEAKASKDATTLLEAELDTVRKELGERTEQAQSSQTKATELEQELEGVRADLEQQTERAAAAESRAEELEASLEEAKSELETERDRAAVVAAELASLQAELDVARQGTPIQGEAAETAAFAGAGVGYEEPGLRAEVDAANQRVAAAEARVLELEEELRVARAATPPVAPSPWTGETGEVAPPSYPVEVAPASTTEELSAVLGATEQAVAHIVEEARRRGEELLQETERRRAEIQAEVDELTAWRDRVQPLIGDVRGSVEETRQRSMSLNDRLTEALDPMLSAVDELSERLGHMEEAPRAPTFESPAGETEFGVEGPAELAVGLPDGDGSQG